LVSLDGEDEPVEAGDGEGEVRERERRKRLMG